MNGSTDHFDVNDEASQLAMVEGLLSVDRTRQMRETLANGTSDQRALLLRLDGMRRDRAGLASLVTPPMSIGMVEAAMKRAQQEALVGLRLVGERSVEIPISRVVPTRVSWWAGGRGLVAAAAVVGLVGGAGLLSLWPKAVATGPRIADGPSSGTQIAIADPANGLGGDVAPVDEPNDPGVDAGPGEGSTNEAAPSLLVPQAPVAVVTPDRGERLLELAKAGRLVIRVTPRSPRQCEQQLASLAARPRGSRAWDVSTTPPAGVVMSLAALTRKSAESPDRHAEDVVPVYASASGQPLPMIVRPPAPLAIALPPKAEDLVGLIRVAPTLDGMEAVRRTLTESLGVVTVAELPEPLTGTDGAGATRTIESTLWWSGPPARWATWASVPVIIER